MKIPTVGMSRTLRAVIGVLALVCVTTAAKRLELQLNYVAVPGFSAGARGILVGYVKLNMSAPGRVAVNLQSSNPSVASVPASVTVPAQSDNGAFNVTAVSGGCASITASYAGKKNSVDVVVHPASSATGFSLSVPRENLHWGAPYTGTFTTDGTMSGTVYLSSSNPRAASVPASIPVKTGQRNAQFSISTAGLGCAIITATIKGGRSVTTTSKTVNVVPLPG